MPQPERSRNAPAARKVSPPKSADLASNSLDELELDESKWDEFVFSAERIGRPLSVTANLKCRDE
jgi:hypothetical protein